MLSARLLNSCPNVCRHCSEIPFEPSLQRVLHGQKEATMSGLNVGKMTLRCMCSQLRISGSSLLTTSLELALAVQDWSALPVNEGWRGLGDAHMCACRFVVSSQENTCRNTVLATDQLITWARITGCQSLTCSDADDLLPQIIHEAAYLLDGNACTDVAPVLP